MARDGSLLRHDELVLDRKANVLRRKTKEYPLDDFYLVEGKGDVTALDGGLRDHASAATNSWHAR